MENQRQSLSIVLSNSYYKNGKLRCDYIVKGSKASVDQYIADVTKELGKCPMTGEDGTGEPRFNTLAFYSGGVKSGTIIRTQAGKWTVDNMENELMQAGIDRAKGAVQAELAKLQAQELFAKLKGKASVSQSVSAPVEESTKSLDNL